MRAPRRTAVFVSLLLVVLGSAGTGARAQKIPTLGETIEIAIVNVDVVVTDKDGKRIHALTGDDFEIYENGKAQPLSHFAEYRGEVQNRGALSAEAAATLDEKPPEQSGNQPSQRRTLVLFIEEFKLPGFRVDAFITSLKDLVRNTIRRDRKSTRLNSSHSQIS